MGSTLSLQQIHDCQEGPKGEKAIGVTVSKTFEGDEFRGIVDRFRKARQRMYYHVTYTDGDEEEMSQTELQAAYVLGWSEVINTEWKKYKTVEDSDVSEVETCDGEGSEYDKAEYNEEVKNNKRKRKENQKSSTKRKKEFHQKSFAKVKCENG